ncbi:hypothetical protein [Legionella rowbothamii]|uniref:hypothetical protein n=1 Tax=Legionella rowbothamii TaxID=96229 RepID=UPI001056A715|nr:hypothetical protein [Legionella rowbothamii]
MTQSVEVRLSKYWFLKTQGQKGIQDRRAISQLGANIINQCQDILAMTDDSYTKQQLNLVIHNTTGLMSIVSASSAKEKYEKDILDACRELQTNILCIPTTIHTPSNLASINHKLSMICMYILLLSVALTIGGSFGALYFGVLSASYVADYLVIALASIGIPALCVGAFSYGIYSAQNDPVSERFTDLVKNIELFCDEVSSIEEENKEERMLVAV